MLIHTCRGPSSRTQAHRPPRHLTDALAGLDPVLQRVVVLKFFERRSTADIAWLFGYSEARVRTLQFRALAQLQRLVAE